MSEPLSTRTVAAAAGASYRQIDYWCRTGCLSPAGDGAGSGNVRRWTVEEAMVAAVLAELSTLGATSEVWQPVARFLSIPPCYWPDRFLVSAAGQITDRMDGAGSGWLVDLAAVRDRVASRLPVPAGS